MKTICCICDILIRDDKIDDAKISHGYCQRCKEFTLETYRRDKTHYVQLTAPVGGHTYTARMDDIETKLFTGLKEIGYTVNVF